MPLDIAESKFAPYFTSGQSEILRKLIPLVTAEVISQIAADPSIIGMTLDDLSDVTVPAPTDLDRLTFDSGSEEWVADERMFAAGDTGSIQYNSAFGVLAGVDTFTFTPASGRGTIALGGTTYLNFTEEDMEVLEVRATNASTAQTANLAVGSGSGAAQAYAGLTAGTTNLFARENGTIDSVGAISLQCDSFICDPAGTPSNLTNGHIWYDSATNKFKARENGVTVDLI